MEASELTSPVNQSKMREMNRGDVGGGQNEAGDQLCSVCSELRRDARESVLAASPVALRLLRLFAVG
jgi:hypothetical protein